MWAPGGLRTQSARKVPQPLLPLPSTVNLPDCWVPKLDPWPQQCQACTSRPGGERGSTSCFSVKNSREASDLGHLLLLGPVCVPNQPGLGHMTLPPPSHCEVTSRAMVVAGLPPAVVPSLACAQPHAGSPRFPPVFPPRASGPHKLGQPCFFSCHPLTCGVGLQGWTGLLFARRRPGWAPGAAWSPWPAVRGLGCSSCHQRAQVASLQPSRHLFCKL